MITLRTTKLQPRPSPEDYYVMLTRVRGQVAKLRPDVDVIGLELRGGIWWAKTNNGWQTVNEITSLRTDDTIDDDNNE